MKMKFTQKKVQTKSNPILKPGFLQQPKTSKNQQTEYCKKLTNNIIIILKSKEKATKDQMIVRNINKIP